MIGLYCDCDEGDGQSFDDAAEEEWEKGLEGPDVASEDSKEDTDCLC